MQKLEISHSTLTHVFYYMPVAYRIKITWEISGSVYVLSEWIGLLSLLACKAAADWLESSAADIGWSARIG